MMTSWPVIAAAIAGVGTVLLLDAFSRRSKGEQLPAFWKQWLFWTVQVAYAAFAVFLAIALRVDDMLTAFVVGVSSPLIMRLMLVQQQRRLDDLDLEKELEAAEKRVEKGQPRQGPFGKYPDSSLKSTFAETNLKSTQYSG